jgi:NAD(P)-dependent dehydrogenase (short-subunit alcohol dehydrogenase family)
MSSDKYNKLAGKHILIFGGTSGLGFGVAAASLASSASITISSSSESRLQSAIDKLHVEFPTAVITGQVCDLSSPNAEQAIESLFEKVREVDHIVYTAADKLATMKVQDITRDKIIAAGQLRFIAPMLVAKVGSRYLSPGPESSIVMTGGTIAERPVPDWTVIAGFAGGVASMARNLALELKPTRVNVVNPGLVDTELWDAEMTPEIKEGMFSYLAGKHPTGKVATAADVAEAYLYLMKDSNISGRVISTDSGSSLV